MNIFLPNNFLKQFTGDSWSSILSASNNDSPRPTCASRGENQTLDQAVQNRLNLRFSGVKQSLGDAGAEIHSAARAPAAVLRVSASTLLPAQSTLPSGRARGQNPEAIHTYSSTLCVVLLFKKHSVMFAFPKQNTTQSSICFRLFAAQFFAGGDLTVQQSELTTTQQEYKRPTSSPGEVKHT